MSIMARVYTDCEPEYLERVKVFARSRGMKMQAWVRQVTEEAMRGKPGPEDGVPPKLQPRLRKLAEILSSGDVEAIDAVVRNVDLFHSRLKPAARE